jgi:hypothetical protein
LDPAERLARSSASASSVIDTIAGQRVEVGLDQILLHIAAVGIDAGDARTVRICGRMIQSCTVRR